LPMGDSMTSTCAFQPRPKLGGRAFPTCLHDGVMPCARDCRCALAVCREPVLHDFDAPVLAVREWRVLVLARSTLGRGWLRCRRKTALDADREERHDWSVP